MSVRRVCGILLCSALLAGAEDSRLIDSFRLDLTPAEVRTGMLLHAETLATEAYLYYVPAFLHLRQINEFIQGRKYFSPDEPALGGWVLVRNLSTPKTENVMANVDTLYGASYLWLERQGPAVLTVPEIKDRYYSVSLYDSWFNVFDVVGTRTTGAEAGSFLIVPPGWTGEKPAGIKAVIRAPTPIINLYQRIYISAHDDIEAIRRLQDRITLSPLSAWPATDKRLADASDPVFSVGNLRTLRDMSRFFELVNRYTALTPPPPGESALTDLFKSIGIGPGKLLPESDEMRRAIARGAANAQTMIDSELSSGPFKRGWRMPSPVAAKPGPHSLNRAATQLLQIGVLPNDEAIYYVGIRDADDQILNGTNRYVLVFPAGQLPPVHKGGFWSVTMYNESSFLAENPIHRYVIRPDTDGLAYNADGSLSIHLRADAPVAELRGNWLPAPRGVFILALRAYMPKAEALTGAWLPSAVTRVKD